MPWRVIVGERDTSGALLDGAVGQGRALEAVDVCDVGVIQRSEHTGFTLETSEDDRTAESARRTLFARLRTERVVKIGRWTRDELHEDSL